MIAYEFYLQNGDDEVELIGILPERRKTSERITEDSIFNWVRNIVSEGTNLRNIFFNTVTMERVPE